MAEQQDNPNSSSVSGKSFNKSLIKDIDDSYIPEGAWSHARNASKVSPNGNLETLGNEPSNLHCVDIPYTCIGTIHLYGDVWAIFSTDDTHSAIGFFDDSECKYTPVVPAPHCPPASADCLGFKKDKLIIGISKQNFDCTWQVYWADNLSPDRTMNMNNPPFIQSCTIVNECNICVNTCNIDCEALRLARLTKAPCLSVKRGVNGGTLQNGSYYAVIAYTINGQRVTDYSVPSNVQSIFEHDNLSGSLEIDINDIDKTHYDEFELVIVRTINQQTSAKSIGLYSVRTNQIFIDYINEALPIVPIELIPFRTPLYNKSEGMYEIGVYAIRVAPTTKFDFNYQPLANQIKVSWVSVEYPADYYRKGGNVTGHMRDEQYPFFVRWVYNTGDKSSSYHIPGRAIDVITPVPGYGIPESSPAPVNQDNLTLPLGSELLWQQVNTAQVINIYPLAGLPGAIVLPDGGTIIADGLMGYWESTEIYPDDKPDIWNASAHPWSDVGSLDYDLCGHNIRHHKFPDNLTSPVTHHVRTGGDWIRVMGVKFDNIRPPVDNNGVPITSIVGYEILRGSREGNKTIIAKGIINNMRQSNSTDHPFPATPDILYQNYPYNGLGNDPNLSATETISNPITGNVDNYTNIPGPRQDVFTFHSPDTQFKNPFLSAREIKTYGEYTAEVRGFFSPVPGHPREKLLSNFAFAVSAIVGLGIAAQAMRGKKNTNRKSPKLTTGSSYRQSTTSIGYTVITESGADDAISSTAGVTVTNASIAANAALNANRVTVNLFELGARSIGNLLATAINPGGDVIEGNNGFLNLFQHNWRRQGTEAYEDTRSYESPVPDYLPGVLKIAGGLTVLSHYWTLGTDSILRLIQASVHYDNYAYRYVSHGFYSQFGIGALAIGQRRRVIEESVYLDDQFQNFRQYKINNLYRGRCVVVQLGNPAGILPFVPPIPFVNPSVTDNTNQSIGSAITAGLLTSYNPNDVKIEFGTTSSCYYAGLKVRISNQYGQMGSIMELPISCVYDNIPQFLNPYPVLPTSPVLFGGDIYVTRHTEKNTFFYFYDWLYQQPDGYEYDYRLRYAINFPTFWADFTQYEMEEFLTNFITDVSSGTWPTLPTTKFSLDRVPGGSSFVATVQALSFRIRKAYFNTFSSGVRDFFVESEINVALRDWGNAAAERHYDPYRYSDVPALFDTPIIKSGNLFKYDISLSISRLYNNFISWGNLQPTSYDPIVAEKCFSYYPMRVLYSLPQSLENKKDYWRVYLANNYRDFKSKVTAIKPINKSGAVILFDTDSPIMFQGVDTLQTSLGTKITIGDGGLFSQPQQSVANTDVSLEYGSCQNRLSVINTPFGLYYMCTNQGKVFHISETLDDITYDGLKFWFKKYLPYALLLDFPSFELTDNPVIGIGCQAIYDNQIETIYFTKRDFKLRTDIKDVVVYLSGDKFLVNGYQTVELGHPDYFEDASWTVSYDPKTKGWISYHDWHPNLLIPSKNNFLSIVDNKIWRHNFRTDSFCNYYGIDYPFELEFYTATGTQVNTTRSIEYYLECYKYSVNSFDKYQLLDFNFDHAIITNTEQTSGVLNLILTPKNDAAARLLYPIIGPTSIDILYSKEEQKYRFNQFWDITDNRGEFSNAMRAIWITDASGYKRILNPLNLNYNKLALQRKKFRHYLSHVFLSRAVSGSTKMIMKVAEVKLLESKR
jgi:hypothetical protein